LSHGVKGLGKLGFIPTIKLNEVRAGSSGIETDGLSYDKGDSFGFKLLAKPFCQGLPGWMQTIRIP
jgi:hypothetical protein